MPSYDYRCQDCRKRVSIYQTYQEYGHQPIRCPECGGRNLQRLINRVRIARSEESQLESLADPSAWGNFDENDPRSMARMMRTMGRELGEDLPPEFDEVVDRLEAGQSPEEIEQDLPDLGAGGDDYAD
ncbi:MAG: zinc ribbon domain-containing protein [Anaerolineales bacterium]